MKKEQKMEGQRPQPICRCGREARWHIEVAVPHHPYREWVLCDECREDLYRTVVPRFDTAVITEWLENGNTIWVYTVDGGAQIYEEVYCRYCGRLVAAGSPYAGSYSECRCEGDDEYEG
jgi:hypothetical protein